MSPRQTAAERQAAEAARMLARPRDTEGVPRPGTTAQRTEPTRTPVTMPMELNRAFKRWGIDAAELGNVAEIPMAAAVRALVRLLTLDDADELVPNSNEAKARKELAELLTTRVIRMVKLER